ncbi:MAG: hypothetical protein EOS76_19610 [Mesorhizobium sp.]|uniref:hypothetical protein n=1 Tax=Mesorhizobium sp. TaxID=1871066 RepID=UPI000FE88026|nr:hypothetical protein [Mesorhizobium sp.]RWE16959.1 MAG: hypothetical protein EOS76_19610 [Mesorhizobium sp.]TIV38019.1 MAG: hypothetical protein E5V91_16065 [Mesorhizobium sp.]
MLTLTSTIAGLPDLYADVYECFVHAIQQLDERYKLKSMTFAPNSEPLATIEDNTTGRQVTYGFDPVYGKLLPRTVFKEKADE